MSIQNELFPEPQQPSTEVSDEQIAQIAAVGDRRNRDRGYDPNNRDNFGITQPIDSTGADAETGVDLLPDVRGDHHIAGRDPNWRPTEAEKAAGLAAIRALRG
jgi:hypothetical protein